MGTMFDYAAREFLARDDGALNTAINNHQYVDENNNPVSDGASKCQSLMTKVKNAGFAINKIEIINNVKNIGKNAFSLVKATATSDVRENSYTGNYIAWDYKCNPNASERINLISLEANLEEVGEDAMLDLNENNINIGENVTVIPNDMFAGYNGGNMIFCNQPPYSANYKRANLDLTIPDNVQVIGVNAFYAYDGSSITFPANLQEIDEYAFANYYGNDITLPAGTTTLKENAFRDFNKKINMSNCPANKLFAPNANIYSNNTLCVFN